MSTTKKTRGKVDGNAFVLEGPFQAMATHGELAALAERVKKLESQRSNACGSYANNGRFPGVAEVAKEPEKSLGLSRIADAVSKAHAIIDVLPINDASDKSVSSDQINAVLRLARALSHKVEALAEVLRSERALRGMLEEQPSAPSMLRLAREHHFDWPSGSNVSDFGLTRKPSTSPQ